jgi:8-oxo-dGTP diphosphatase
MMTFERMVGERWQSGTMSTPEIPRINVAVGILVTADGRFLLAARPAGKPLAGYWEFPGGKLEAGETVASALERELREEVGIDWTASGDGCRQLPVVEHDYPHASVRLHACIVMGWRGEPTAREGQQFSWQSLADQETTVSPVLPATVPIIRKLRSLRNTLGAG